MSISSAYNSPKQSGISNESILSPDLDTVYEELLAYNDFSDAQLRDLSDEKRKELNQKVRYLGNNMFDNYNKLSSYEDVYYSMADRLEKLGFPKN